MAGTGESSTFPPYTLLAVSSGCLCVCIAHVSPFFELPDDVLLIKTRDFNHKNIGISLPSYIRGRFQAQTIPDYTPDYAWLVIEDILSGAPEKIDRVCILLHRKIVVPHQQGLFIKNENTFYDVGKNVSLDTILPIITKKRIFFPRLERFDSIISQYARSHSLADFIELTEICLKIGILERSEVNRFAYSQIMTRGGGLIGVIPADILLVICSKIRALVVYALCHGFKPAQSGHPYQARALSFFIERLSSYFLLCEISRIGPAMGWSNDEVFQGNLLTTAEGDTLPDVYVRGTVF